MTAGIAAVARAHPDRTAIAAGARRLTFADLDRRANRAARALFRLGVRTGDRVALGLANRPEFFEVAAAVARLGAEVVPVPWRAMAGEVAYLVEDSGARVLVAEADARDRAAGLPTLHLDGYEAALAAEDDAPLGDRPAPFAFRYYTSGTTGRPKAVERPRPEPVEGVERARRYLGTYGIEGEGHVHLACGPLYHTAPCAFACYALLFGHPVVLMERFDAADCLRLIERERVTWTHMVPINFVRILALPAEERAGADLSSVRRVLHAAAPCPVAVKRAIMGVFPPGTVWEYYGMTEGLATVISPEEWLAHPGSVGRAAPGQTVAILDDDGRALPAGEVGLVYVSGHGGARFSYAGAPEKTAEAWRGDLYTVGDMGILDAEGYLYLTDRRQDLIITGGANVYPAEVEAVLHEHDAVADCAVVGAPDDEWGERVHALVEARAPVEPEALVAFCRERLAHYKCPRTVELVEALLRDPNGKVRKRELRERLWAGRDRRI